ncbi:hypothetical protein QUF54_11140, partial [Candidatus Marithioploca araucensis]|nr:hypothetical protein [Candidatus Marithioploca araucensis]
KGKQIYTYIICTHFPTPSRLPVPEVLKLTETEKVAGRMLSLENLTDEQISQVTGVSLEKIEYLRQLIEPFSSAENSHIPNLTS